MEISDDQCLNGMNQKENLSDPEYTFVSSLFLSQLVNYSVDFTAGLTDVNNAVNIIYCNLRSEITKIKIIQMKRCTEFKRLIMT